MLGCLLLLCIGMLPWLAPSTAHAAADITFTLSASGANVGDTFGYRVGQSTRLARRVTGPFTLEITFSERITGLGNNHFSLVGGTFTTPLEDATDQKVWKTTITVTSTAAFQINAFLGSSPTIQAADGSGDTLASPTTKVLLVYHDVPPTFSAATRAESIAEGTTTTTDIATLAATDGNTDHTVTYAITATGGGADGARFTIAGTSSDRLRFVAVPDYENPTDAVSATPTSPAMDNKYIVIVTASSTSPSGSANYQTSDTDTTPYTLPAQTATQTFTITVTDENEPPSAPDAPSVTADNATPTELSVSWNAPTNTGKPAISDYDVQYRAGTSGGFTDHAHTGTTTEATLTGLTQNTAYQVQVRATNDEGTGDWSASGTATTAANAAPVFSSAATASVPENTTAVLTVQAADSDSSDSVTGYALSGTDSGAFTLNGTTGVLTFSSAPDFENPTDVAHTTPAPADTASNNTYIVFITATSGTGGRALTTPQRLTITVTNQTNEVPSAPDAPSVTADNATPTELSVEWNAPTNTGKPAITDYDVQYRAGTSGGFTNHPHTGTTTEATITGLTQNTAYQVQVRATNADGTGTWSASGSATTAANVAPAFSSAATKSVPENTTAVLTVQASDSDASDSVTGYALSGTDSGAFTLNGTTGVLTFSSAPDFENPTDVAHTTPAPTDAASNNVYIVFITATSGAGARVLSTPQRVEITVGDVDEPPSPPPTFGVTSNVATPTKLSLSWGAPSTTGKPAISGYDVAYRAGTSGTFLDAGFSGTGTSMTLENLTQGTQYQVRVRAKNAEGMSAWNNSSWATQPNVAPMFRSGTTAFNLPENRQDVTTTDAVDTDTVTTDTVEHRISGGADGAKFSINAETGELTFTTAPDFESPQDVQSTAPANAANNNEYVVVVQAQSGAGERQLTAEKTLVVTVTNVAVPPKLAAPGLTEMTLTSVSIEWTAPADAGLAITGYDVQYRQGSSGAFTDAGFTGTGTATVLTGLTQHVLHEIQVRATNAEGSGPWSDAVTAVPQDNTSPRFISDAAVTVAENTPAGTPVVTVVAVDGDPADEIMGYTLSGTDSGAFTFDASSGVLRFRVSPDYGNPTDVAHTSSDPEDEADAAGNNTYIVFITVTSGTGDRRLIKTQRLAITVTAVDDMSVGLVLESSVALTEGRRVTSEPSWTVTFDFSKPLAAAGDGAFSVSDISVSGAGTATFGELTRAESDDIRYTVPVTVSAEGTYTFQVKSGSVATAAGDTYGGAASPLVVIYNTPPVITNVEVVPPPETGYIAGSELSLELTFDDDNVNIPANVDITNRPYIVLYLGERTAANQRRAYWQSARDANSTVVTFAYEVQSDDVANVVHWEPRLVVPETAPITNGVTAIIASAPTGADIPSDVGTGGIVTFPSDTTQPTPGQPQEPVAPLTQEVPVRGAPVVFLPPETVQPVKSTQIPRTPLIFNELGNGASGANDWLELRNVTAEAVPLKNWGISIVADAKKVDEPLVRFPSDAAFRIPPKGLLLITRRPPEKTRLAGGIDIANPGKTGKTGAVHHYFVAPEFTLPDDGQFLLILRNATGKLGKGENVIDVAGGGGPNTDAFIADKGDAFQTDIWPLQATAHPREDTAAALAAGKVWRRAKTDSVGYHKDAWMQAAYTGVGYDRVTETSPATAGTPGYPNDAVKPVAATPRGSVTFSELMLDSAGGKLPQWIELYNASKTEALNLNSWKLELQNVDSEDLVGRPVVTLTLKEKIIQPNQTLLIVAGDARASSADVFPAARVYNLLNLHEKNLRIKTARDTFLSAEGFTLKLRDSNGQLVDEVGNTDGNRRTRDAPAWQFPFAPVESGRSSLIRRYDKGIAEDGKAREGWVLAANITRFSADVAYGHQDDKGTPGYREGGALPVELSRFSMTRNEAGAVVLTWTTESEVDNAGFNLRRSEKRDSGFTLLNPALIAGAGTTGERQTYTFTDSSAKPGVEYYYQIEEVASDGKPATLAMRLLRGSVSASNRILTTFGEVKKAK